MARAAVPALAFDQDGRIAAVNEGFRELLGYRAGELERARVDDRIVWRDLAGNRYTFDGIHRMVRDGEMMQPFSIDVATTDGEFVRTSVSLSLVLGRAPLDYFVVLQCRPERRRRATDRWADAPHRSDTPSDEIRLQVRAAVTGKLTRREVQVLKRLSEGASTEGIAADLGITVSTVRNHVQNLLRKLDAGSRSEAVAIALRSRLI